jgi:hypothetical protein
VIAPCDPPTDVHGIELDALNALNALILPWAVARWAV